MAFYSTEEYLAESARRGRMEMKGKTPPPPPGIIHPPDGERQKVQSLLNSIPETQPGPNAFARPLEMTEKRRGGHRRGQSHELERKKNSDVNVGYPQSSRSERREGNSSSTSSKAISPRDQLMSDAAYQAALANARTKPPTITHPAIRQRAISNPPLPPRDSACTTWTEFINADKQAESPKLKLKATPNPSSVPTFRGRVEERQEQVEYDRSGSQEERVPVFHPTPRLAASKDFAQRPSTPADMLSRDDGASKIPTKTPKKSIFSKLKLSANSRSAHGLSGGGMPADPADQVEERVPVKAQAVLGETPKKQRNRLSLGSPTQIPRSPSKRNYFFPRKNVENAGPASRPSTLPQIQRPPDTPSNVASADEHEPQTAISDPTHFSYQGRVAGWSNSTTGTATKQQATVPETPPMVARSKSMTLNYLNDRISPTPPAKNTPPEEKAAREAKEVNEMREAMKMPRQRLLEDDEGIESSNDRISPTKFGSYGYRSAPKMVAQKSMISLHASLVPEDYDAAANEEMQARMSALDIEGLNSPADNIIRRSNIQDALYSPSVYSPDVGTMQRFTNNKPGSTPLLTVQESRWSDDSTSAHTKGTSSNGTIPIVYPDLHKDPNYIAKHGGSQHPENENVSPVRGRSNNNLSPELTWHGRTHSRDHLDENNDRQGLFAEHVDKRERRMPAYNLPPAFSHASAMPSPLHYLPATTYTPLPGKGKGRGLDLLQTGADDRQITFTTRGGGKSPTAGRGSGLGIEGGESVPRPKVSKRDSGIFQIEPVRPGTSGGSGGGKGGGYTSAPNTTIHTKTSQSAASTKTTSQQHTDELSTSSVERRKQAAASLLGVSGDKMALILEMLNKRNDDITSMREVLHKRDHDIASMRDELRQSHASINQRISLVESQQRSPSGYSQKEVDAWAQAQAQGQVQAKAKRVSMDVAHEFYRDARQENIDEAGHGGEARVGSQEDAQEGGGEGESETIRELRESNKKLLEMVSGFAGKLEALETKMGRGSG